MNQNFQKSDITYGDKKDQNVKSHFWDFYEPATFLCKQIKLIFKVERLEDFFGFSYEPATFLC
jgi:hypothetical protein